MRAVVRNNVVSPLFVTMVTNKSRQRLCFRDLFLPLFSQCLDVSPPHPLSLPVSFPSLPNPGMSLQET